MKRPLDSLVADIADDVSVDWRKLEEASQPDELVREFRIIAAIGAERASDPTVSRGHRAIRFLLALAVLLSTIKLAVAVAVVGATVPFRIGPLAVMAVLFSTAGLALLIAGRREERARCLGTLFVVIGAAFVNGYLLRAQTPMLGQLARWPRAFPPESLLALALWSFAWVFPVAPVLPQARRLGSWGLGLSIVAGVALLLANATKLAGTAGGIVGAVLHALDRDAPAEAYFPVVCIAGIGALPFLLWKSRGTTVEHRSRVTLFAAAIVGGLAPFIVAVLATPFVPALVQPPLRGRVGGVLYFALAFIVPATAYAVLVRKVIDLHLAFRRAVQHALARQIVWALTFGTVGYAAVRFYLGRDRALADLLSEQVGLVSLTALGFAALAFRAQALSAVDRWFERGAADYSQVMTRLASRLSGQRNIRDLHAALDEELVRTLQAAHVAIVVVNDDRSAFVSLDGKVNPLPASSAIAGLFKSAREGLCLRGDSADQLARLLPRPDREWLAAANVEWVFPLFDSSESVIGLVGLGQGRGPAFSKRDRVLVSAMADQVALRMENLSLRHGSPRGGGERDAGQGAPIDWQNERAMQCSRCQRVRPADATLCDCGARLEPATLPLVLNRKFKVERVLGAGGMSVVYLALDTDLNRRVAIKTMPNVTPRHVARLQREAQAMASVLHPNLAMIYGAERWRDVPLLVVEYLDGGTLLDGLRAGPLSVEDAVDLGIVLADALDRMHAGGLLHRDIKPSNIGYTADGLPKLLDFGLAAMLDRVNVAVASVAVAGESGSAGVVLDTWSQTSSHTQTQHLVGTPLYLSPEALGGQEPDQSFDLWSLGVVIYEAVAGRHPFAGYPTVEVMRRTRSVRVPDVRDFRGDCPPALAAFLNDALSLSQERRPATAAAFRMQLQSIRQSIAVGTHHALPPLY